jgi:hypothetical protein
MAMRTFTPDCVLGKLRLTYIYVLWIGICNFSVSEDFVAFRTGQNPAGDRCFYTTRLQPYLACFANPYHLAPHRIQVVVSSNDFNDLAAT